MSVSAHEDVAFRYGDDHPKVAIRLNNLAALLQATNRLAEAVPLLQDALRIFHDSLGPDHPDAVGVLGNLDALLAEMRGEKQGAGTLLSPISQGQ